MKKDNKVKNIDREYKKLLRSNDKKKATIIVLIFAMVLMAIVIVLFYFGLINGPSCKEALNTKECNCPVCTVDDLGD